MSFSAKTFDNVNPLANNSTSNRPSDSSSEIEAVINQSDLDVLYQTFQSDQELVSRIEITLKKQQQIIREQQIEIYQLQQIQKQEQVSNSMESLQFSMNTNTNILNLQQQDPGTLPLSNQYRDTMLNLNNIIRQKDIDFQKQYDKQIQLVNNLFCDLSQLQEKYNEQHFFVDQLRNKFVLLQTEYKEKFENMTQQYDSLVNKYQSRSVEFDSKLTFSGDSLTKYAELLYKYIQSVIEQAAQKLTQLSQQYQKDLFRMDQQYQKKISQVSYDQEQFAQQISENEQLLQQIDFKLMQLRQFAGCDNSQIQLLEKRNLQMTNNFSNLENRYNNLVSENKVILVQLEHYKVLEKNKLKSSIKFDLIDSSKQQQHDMIIMLKAAEQDVYIKQMEIDKLKAYKLEQNRKIQLLEKELQQFKSAVKQKVSDQQDIGFEISCLRSEIIYLKQQLSAQAV